MWGLGFWACKSPFEYLTSSPSCPCHMCPERHSQCLCGFCSWADRAFVFWESLFPFFLSERCVSLATLVLSLSCIQPCFKLPVTHSSWQELILGSSCSANQKYRHPGKWGQSGQTQHFAPRLLIICFPFYCSSISILKDIFESQSWLGF